jgi:endonuclease-3
MPRRGKTETTSAVKTRLRKILRQLERDHPDAKLELDFSSPLELLVALILAAQARDDLVNQITPQLFRNYRTAKDYAGASPEELENAVRRVNFFRSKALRIQTCCREIVRRFRGRVPDEIDDLLLLPGVGRKTANILLGNAFGRQTIGVDTHVMRLSQRLGFTDESNPDKIEADLLPVVPEDQRTRLCHLLQYHGRRICLANKPRCPECRIRAFCPYPAKTEY